MAAWATAALTVAIQLFSLAYAWGDLNARVKALEATDARHEVGLSCVMEIKADVAWIKRALEKNGK